MSRTTPVSAVPAGLMHRCLPPQMWAGRLRASRLSSPPQPVSPRPVYRSVYGDGRGPAGFCTSPVLLVAASPWPPAVVSRLAKRPASVGLALTRRTRPRPSCSEEDGPRDPLATRSTARATALQTVTSHVRPSSVTCGDAGRLDRRSRPFHVCPTRRRSGFSGVGSFTECFSPQVIACVLVRQLPPADEVGDQLWDQAGSTRSSTASSPLP
jgi:hypothetical protein